MMSVEQKKISSDALGPVIKRAINLLMKDQISDTLILSSYKISTVIKNYFGQDFKTEQIGRKLAKIAKTNKLRRISTRIPKYELRKSNFIPFELPD